MKEPLTWQELGAATLFVATLVLLACVVEYLR
jgi:hypothetical protein